MCKLFVNYYKMKMKKGKALAFPHINKLMIMAIVFLVFALVAHAFVSMFKAEHAKEKRELFTDACGSGMCSL